MVVKRYGIINMTKLKYTRRAATGLKGYEYFKQTSFGSRTTIGSKNYVFVFSGANDSMWREHCSDYCMNGFFVFDIWERYRR